MPNPDSSTDDLIREISQNASRLPGNKFDFSQPIQMRFNELIAGVKEDLAIKVFGDEFEPMRRAANQIASILAGIRGAAEVKVEDVTGMPVLETVDERKSASRKRASVRNVARMLQRRGSGARLNRASSARVLGKRKFSYTWRGASTKRTPSISSSVIGVCGQWCPFVQSLGSGYTVRFKIVVRGAWVWLSGYGGPPMLRKDRR